MSAHNPLFLRRDELDRGIELLYVASRGFGAGARRLLEPYGLGHAHHLVLHFVGRRPDVTAVELQSLLGLSKQTMSRLVRQLAEQGLVERVQDERDRRVFLLRLTETGTQVFERLNSFEREQMARAFRSAGAEAVEGFRQVLSGLVEPVARRRLDVVD